MRFDPMPEYMRDEILEGVFLLSDKELLEARRDMNQSLYQYGFNRLLSACLTDSTTMPVDSLISLLLADGSFNSLLKQAWILLETGDTTGALNQISNISSQLELTSEEYNELNQQQSYLQWIIANPIVDAIATETLVNFMQSSSSSVSSAARSILVANDMMVYDEPYLAPDLTKKTTVKLPKQKGSLNNPEVLRVYPNPTSNYITIEFDLGDEASDALIEIIDASGKIVWVKKSNKSKNQLVADVQMLSTGNYLARLYSNRHLIASKTFVIYK